MGNKNDYIEVEALFDKQETNDFEDMGIKLDTPHTEMEVYPRVIFTDKIVGLGPSPFNDVVALHMLDGYSFFVKGDYKEVLDLIYGRVSYNRHNISDDDII